MKVLYVEGNARDADLARHTLARTAPHVDLEVAATLGEARACLTEGAAFDVVLTDLNLPDGSGLDLVADIRERAPPLAVVVLTGADAAHTAVAALKAGADDILVKRDDYLARLPAILESAVARIHAETVRRGRPLRVLYAEDSAGDADLIRCHFARHAPHIRLDAVHGASELLHRLPGTSAEPSSCDVLLLDYCLSGVDAFKVLKALCDERHLALPVVLVTGQGDGEVAAQAFRFGAENHVVKHPGYLFELPAVLEAAHDRALLEREQAALRASEERLRHILDTSMDAVIGMSSDGLVTEWSTAAEQIFGHARQHVLGRDLSDLIVPPSLRDAHRRGLQRFLETGESHAIGGCMEVTGMRADGSEFPVELALAHVRRDGESFFSAFLRDITERKHAEEVLRASERRYERVVRHMSDALIVDDLGARLVYANERFFEMFGIVTRDLRSITLDDYVAPEWKEPLLDRHRRRIRGENVEDRFEYQGIRADGTRIWLDVSVAKVLENGQVIGTQSAIRDITDRKLTEDALQLLSTGIAHLRGEAFFNQLSAQLSRLLRVEVGFVGKLLAPGNDRIRTLGLCTDGEVIPPVEFGLAGTPYEAVIDRGMAIFPDHLQQLFPSDRMLVDLNVASCAAVALFDSSGRAIGYVGVMGRAPLRRPEQAESILRLFAVRAAAEIERQGAETRFKDLFEFSPDASVIVNQDGKITQANRRAETLFGYSHEGLVGLAVENLIPETRRKEHVGMRRKFVSNATSRQMGSAQADLRAQRKDGTTFPADISLSPLHSDEGMLVVATVRDITERRRDEERRQALELQMYQSRKMEAIGTLAGGIAHDFNNVISAIIGNVELAREDVGADHPAIESLDEIGKASRRARDLVSQILAFSRQQPHPRHAVALPSVVEEVVKLLRATLPAGIKLGTTLAEDVPNVLADPTQIHQILMNLCTNAWHAMDDGRGRIDIQIDTVMLGEDAARIHADLQPGRYAHLSVNDTGKGMDAVTLERIFEPFFTTKAVGEGTGLGLSVVHGIMRGYQGAITVDSQIGGGTTFHLYFPASDAAAGTAAAEKAPAAPLRGRGQHVLYLDDDESLVFLVTRMLERSGYRVTGYTEPAHALQAVRADPGRFDLVVTDYNMSGMSGLDVAREVSRIRPDLPIVVTSGYITDELREKAPGAGVRQLVYKPNSAEELCETVRRLMDEGN